MTVTTSPRPIITLLSDFGNRDAYVGSMKGVILGLNPEAVLVDLTHDLPPQNLVAGALVLAGAAPFFPPGTIHLAVVDPGVGSSRRALAARCRGQFWVGPDNGLFHLVFKNGPDLRVVSLEKEEYFLPRVAPTFHGRDIFAPVAARLSLGMNLKELGREISDPVPLKIPEPVFALETVRGEIIYVDHFGNLVSNLSAAPLREWLGGRKLALRAGTLSLGEWSRTYADAAPGEFLALEGSHGYLEIACTMDNAARRLGAGVGLLVEIRRG
jgi:S-adenosylmethionine hydrolase